MKTHIVIHHSKSPDETESFDVTGIRNYHLAKGWIDIGYHFIVEKVGEYYEVIQGRDVHDKGAHCIEENMNSNGIGICLVGDFDKEKPPSAAIEKLIRLCRSLCETHGIPVANILGHREVGLMAGYDWQKSQYKSCPGAQFDMDIFRNKIRGKR